jgi:hypothetical protein
MMAAQQAAQSAQIDYARGYYGSTDPSVNNDQNRQRQNAVTLPGGATNCVYQ